MSNLFRLTTVVSSILALAVLTGCGPQDTADQDTPANASGSPSADGHEDGQHPTEGPHGGHLIEFGEEEYHAELLHDEDAHTVTIHLLDSSGTESVSGDEPEITMQLFQDGAFVSYTFKAADGTSEFSLVDEQLCDMLCHAEEMQGRLSAKIAGKDYVGLIEHHAHDHEGHDSDDGHDHDGDGHDQDDHEHSDDGDGHDHDGDGHDHP